MIGSFRHKGLRLLFEQDVAKGVNPDHVHKLKQILFVLQAADRVEAMEFQRFDFTP